MNVRKNVRKKGVGECQSVGCVGSVKRVESDGIVDVAVIAMIEPVFLGCYNSDLRSIEGIKTKNGNYDLFIILANQ